MNTKKHYSSTNHMYFLMTILVYIHWNKLHSFHHIHNQFQSLHDFINRIIRGLPPANHHWAMSHRVMGQSALELADDKSNALIHEIVQIGGLTRQFHHHANL